MDNGDEAASDSSVPAVEEVSVTHVPLHTTNLITILDENGVVRYESPAIERLFGYDPSALVGDSLVEYIHPEDRKDAVNTFQVVVASDEETTETVEYRHQRADGTYCWVESTTSTDPTPDGYYVINTRDISNEKARERDLELAQERLKEFAGVVSHDLRDPLQVAQGRLELIDGDETHLDAIEQAHDGMRTLIDNLLTLVHDGVRINDPGPVEIASVVTDCWQNIDTAAATLAVETDQLIQADRSRLRQLLANLIRNAIEHGGEHTRIEVGPLPDGFYVADDGPGIGEPARTRLFELGYSAGTDGAGVGLSIVEQVSHAHNWEVTVTDGIDGGARFEFTGVTVAETGP